MRTLSKPAFRSRWSWTTACPLCWPTPGAVTRILTNLIGNALKHSSAALTIRLYADAGQLVTAFSNDAPDLSPEDLSRVFERFYTADQMRTGQNTGLGLAIVKALAQRMDTPPLPNWRTGVSPWGCGGSRCGPAGSNEYFHPSFYFHIFFILILTFLCIFI